MRPERDEESHWRGRVGRQEQWEARDSINGTQRDDVATEVIRM